MLERGEQVDVVDEAREARALGDHLAAEGDDEGAAAEVVHVGRDLAEPAHEASRDVAAWPFCSFFKL